MSLSLPHHTQQVLPQLPPPGAGPATAAVTRILVLSDFSPSLKTRDLQGVFQPWEAERGGFRVKWIDDVTALVVFQDATVAKRAYLSLLLNPPPALPYPAAIKPYDGPDAQAIIHSVAARQHGQQRASMSGSGAGVMSGSMAQGIVLSAGTNGGFGAGSREPPQSGITGYGHARTGSRVQQQHQQQGDPSSINAAMTGLGITTYPRHGRSASTSSLSASEPLHGSAARAGGAESYAIGSGSSGGGGAGVGRIIGGTGAHGRHGSSGSSAFGRNSAMGAFAFGGKESTTASTGGIGRAGKDVATTTTSSGSGNGPINEEPSSSTTPTTNNNVPAPPVASSAAFRSSVSGARGTGTTQGLATHHETDSPTGTPTKTSASGSSPNARAGDTAAAAAATAHGQVAGTTEDVGTPGIEILGAVPFPEGGPGGYLASKERRASSGKASGVGEVTVAEVFGNVRRESLDAKSAEKALREVSRALEGLGVGVGVAAAAGKS